MRRILLLTAQPYRRGRDEKVAEAWIGPVTFQAKKIYVRTVYVQVVNIKLEDKLELKTRKIGKKHIADYNMNVNELVKHDERNDIIIEHVLRLASEGRQILVLSDRCDKIKHLHKLQEITLQKNKDITTSILYGKTKKCDRSDALKAQIIFSSYDMAGEGLDVPTISVVVLTTPKSYDKNAPSGTTCLFVQSIMRAIRGVAQLYDPIILDFTDDLSLWWKYWNSRKAYYASQGYTMIYYKNEKDQSSSDFSMNKSEKKRKTIDYDTSSNKRKQDINVAMDDDICPL